MTSVRLPPKTHLQCRLGRATVTALDGARRVMVGPPSRSGLIASILADLVASKRLPAVPKSWQDELPVRRVRVRVSLPAATLSGLDRICASARPRPTRSQLIATALATWCERRERA